jgi:hypothetical protein
MIDFFIFLSQIVFVFVYYSERRWKYMKKVFAIISALFVLGVTLITLVFLNQNKDIYKDLAKKYADSQISSVEQQQNSFIYAGLGKSEDNRSNLVIKKARIDKFEEIVTYKGYKAYSYQVSYLPNDIKLAVPVGSWTICEDGWLKDGRPVYLIFDDSDKPKLVGEMVCEFSPDGNADMFYETFDLWISNQE